MKTARVTILVTSISFLACAQDVVTLDSGKKLECELLEYENGVLTFRDGSGDIKRGPIAKVKHIKFDTEERNQPNERASDSPNEGTPTVSGESNTAGKQQARKALINKLIEKGIFQKVEVPGDLPHLWVKQAFYRLDFDTKSQFVSVVYAYYLKKNPKYHIVVLYDNHTGKKIGEFAEVYGGLKLK